MNTVYPLSIGPALAQTAAQESPFAIPKIVLLDDDRMFCRSMEHIARKMAVPLQAFAKLEDIPKMMNMDFDLAILDFDLGAITGAELAAFMDARVGGIPIVMVSFTRREPLLNAPWPETVHGFVLKDVGPEAILGFALETYQKSKIRNPKKKASKKRKVRTFP